MSATTFRAGQQVRMASGGPDLTVILKTEDEWVNEAAAGGDANATTKVTWFTDAGELKVATIPTSALIEATASVQQPIDPKALTEEDLKQAADQLRLSGRGQRTLELLVAWLDEVGLGLDGPNQQAVYVLLAGAWGAFPSAARDLMRGS